MTVAEVKADAGSPEDRGITYDELITGHAPDPKIDAKERLLGTFAVAIAKGKSDKVFLGAILDALLEAGVDMPPPGTAGAAMESASEWGRLREEIRRYKLRTRAKQIGDEQLAIEAALEAGCVPTGWEVVPLDKVSPTPEVPTVACREDGQRLFYKGKVNTVFGDSEGGKSWLCLLAAAQELRSGRSVTYIDYEDSARGIKNRLIALGVPEDVVNEPVLFRYMNPWGPIGDLLESERQQEGFAQCTLVVVDAMTEALAAAGLSSVSDVDVAQWFNTFAKPIAALGPAVVVIDHMNLSDKGRVTGSQHKKSAVDGLSLRVKKGKSFAPGVAGHSDLYVAKDRPGAVRAVAEEDYAGRFVVPASIAGDDGMKRACITVPTPALTVEERAAATEYLLDLTVADLESEGRSITVRSVSEAFRAAGHSASDPVIRDYVRQHKEDGV